LTVTNTETRDTKIKKKNLSEPLSKACLSNVMKSTLPNEAVAISNISSSGERCFGWVCDKRKCPLQIHG